MNLPKEEQELEGEQKSHWKSDKVIFNLPAYIQGQRAHPCSGGKAGSVLSV